MQQKNSFLSNLLIKIIKTVGLCAGAYIILTLLNNYGQNSTTKKRVSYNQHFKNKKPEKIIEAKIETWR